MYQHGMATLMLAEVAGMTDGALGKEVRKALEKAVALLVKAQRSAGAHRGGWRYGIFGTDADMSVTGWQVLALRAAKNLGCDVPAKTIDRAVEFIKACYEPRSGGFAYMPRSRVTIPCTGSAVLNLELAGKEYHACDEAVRGAGFLIRNRNLPNASFMGGYYFYSAYYGAQATFQVGAHPDHSNVWTVYRSALHRAMLRHQKGNGSWQGGSEAVYGPNFCTALAILSLTVEYRYLPIYQRAEPTEKKR
jgi:hypothetical protein